MATTQLGLFGTPWRPYGGFVAKEPAADVTATVSESHTLFGTDTQSFGLNGTDTTSFDLFGIDDEELPLVGG